MLVAILFLTQLFLLALGLLGPWRDPPALKTNGRLPLWARMLLGASLLVAAFLIWVDSPKDSGVLGITTPFFTGSFRVWSGGRTMEAVYAQWVMLGMLASFIGDLIMAKLIPLPNRLIGGMIAFGIAHALYIAAFSAIVQSFDSAIVGLAVGLVFYGIVSIGGWHFLIRNPQKPKVINIGALVYGMWISVMASFALALAVAVGGAFWLTALGGLLFVISDFIIGVTDIRGISIKNANDWIWLTYVGAQMGIIYAGAVARQPVNQAISNQSTSCLITDCLIDLEAKWQYTARMS